MLARNDEDGFARSRARFEEVVGFLDGDGASGLSHADLEERLGTEGRGLLRLLYQDHLDLRAEREQRPEEVVDAHGVDRTSVEAGHHRALTTVFGAVTVTRLAYRRRGEPNLHPADAALNLPAERHSHGVRRLAAPRRPGLLRRRHPGHPLDDRRPGGQAPGGGAGGTGGSRLRRLLHAPSSP